MIRGPLSVSMRMPARNATGSLTSISKVAGRLVISWSAVWAGALVASMRLTSANGIGFDGACCWLCSRLGLRGHQANVLNGLLRLFWMRRRACEGQSRGFGRGGGSGGVSGPLRRSVVAGLGVEAVDFVGGCLAGG